jgi:hypothetical protein
MANPGDQLRDEWILSDNGMTAAGDAAAIDELLGSWLKKIATDASGWRILYVHEDTQQFWELSYPASEMQGGGPRLLTCLAISTAAQWSASSAASGNGPKP